MAIENKFHVGKPPFFQGENYDHWKTRMTVHIKALSKKMWVVVNEGFVVLDEDNKTPTDNANEELKDQAMNVLYDALSLDEFQKVKGLETAYAIWNKLKEIYEGTTTVREAKLYVYKGHFNDFEMKDDEDVPTMFTRLNNVVNNLKILGFDVSNQDFSHKFLKCLPEKYETIVTMLIRSDLRVMTPTQVLGEVVTNEMFKKSQKKAHSVSSEGDKKNIAFKANSSSHDNKNEKEDEDSDSDKEMALFVKRFKKFMKKRNNFSKGQSSRKNLFEDRKCFECGEVGHISSKMGNFLTGNQQACAFGP
ncbi:unnamed protein product [Urochloa humidicola]